jgi:hypothetical protein
MNSAIGYSEGADLYIQKPIVMDLTKRREELLSQKEKLEQVKSDAHKGIIAINVKLRKLEAVARDAEELFEEKAQGTVLPFPT